jgi:mono/diheme cytochrome c family protein
VRAIAAYIASMMAKQGESRGRVEDNQAQATQAHPQGAELYAGICATCHESGGHVPFTIASLGQHTSLYAPDPRNVIHVILEGVHPSEGAVGAVMPAFADTLSDAQIGDLVAYLRMRFSGGARWQNVEDEIAKVRRRTSR